MTLEEINIKRIHVPERTITISLEDAGPEYTADENLRDSSEGVVLPSKVGSSRPVDIPGSTDNHFEQQLNSVVNSVRQFNIEDEDVSSITGDSSESDAEQKLQIFSYSQNDESDSELPASCLHWDKLKEKFKSSSWFREVEEILQESTADLPERACISNPAETFYNTAMDIYLKELPFDEFLDELRSRSGSAWDDRLSQPAYVFFNTAATVTSIVGAGRFFGGAFRFGQATVNSAIDQLIEKWQQILGVTEDAVDVFLPEVRSRTLNSTGAPVEEQNEEGFEADDEKRDIAPLESGLKKRRRGVTDLYSKVSRRVKQRMPSFESIRFHVKQKLDGSYWFQKVDDILMQNVLLRSLGGFVSPAEHFYETAVATYENNRRNLSEFLLALKMKLGGAWDDRLEEAACEFYESATDVSENELEDDE